MFGASMSDFADNFNYLEVSYDFLFPSNGIALND